MNDVRRLKTEEDEKQENIFKLNLRGHQIERHAPHAQTLIIIVIVVCVWKWYYCMLWCRREND